MAYDFAKATVATTPEGDLAANVSCLNGDTSTGTSFTLSSSAVYFDGASISAGEEILFRVDSGGTMDESHIFPYDTSTGNPLRLGGGIGKGNIIEEDEAAATSNPVDPGVEVTWINGLNADGVISNVSDEAALNINVGTAVYFLMTYDENTEPEVLTVTVSEGTCGDVPAGDSQFSFGGVGQAVGG